MGAGLYWDRQFALPVCLGGAWLAGGTGVQPARSREMAMRDAGSASPSLGASQCDAEQERGGKVTSAPPPRALSLEFNLFAEEF